MSELSKLTVQEAWRVCGIVASALSSTPSPVQDVPCVIR